MGYGRNCCIPLCYANDDPDYIPKVGFLQFPKLQRPDYISWRNNLVAILQKHRVLQPDGCKRIADEKMFICTLHFEEEDIHVTGKGYRACHLI